MNPMSRDSDLPACLACGTCCFSDIDRYVRVTGNDYERLGDDAETFVQFLGNRAYMRMADGHCAALEVVREHRAFVCRVYEQRPQICRDLERGSAQCLGERDTKGERPARALDR